VRAVIDEALRCKETGEEKTILFSFSGHGHFDMAAYDAYMAGGLPDYAMSRDTILRALEESGVAP
jgi:tryptophan synthase beta chain